MKPALQNKSTLVTGAGGFIGSHLVERLVAQGAKVRALVHYNSRRDAGWLSRIEGKMTDRVEIVAGDLRDSGAVSQAVEGCQVVFHLGALISIPYSYQRPLDVTETNVLGTLNVLTACRRFRVERIVHTSTSEVYGTARRVPIDESHPLQGQSPYSAGKIGADKLAESFFCAFGLPVVTVRPFNTYGPRQSTRAVIPVIITQALGGRVVKLGNLESTRDFTYVSDTVEGFLRAAEIIGVEGQVFNLGTGSEISVGALAARILQLTGSSARIEPDPARLRPEASEVRRLVSDNARARSTLGWAPQTNLDEGLRVTIEWFRENLHLYRVGAYEL